MGGWIKLHRNVQEHWIWKDKPFTKGQAWIDILLMVNHDAKKDYRNGKIVTVERGQKITSILRLADRWGWSRKKVSRFLDDLESDRMLEQKRTTKDTTLTVVNYGIYQSKEQQKEQQKSSPGTSEEQQKHTNKNIKNIKKEKKEIYSDELSASKIPFKEIIDYLNQKSGKKFKSSREDTKKHIRARFSEGHTVDDFKRVIDVKVAEWNVEPGKGQKDMRQYIRPVTLFGKKFESYLNQAPQKGDDNERPGTSPAKDEGNDSLYDRYQRGEINVEFDGFGDM